MKVLKKFKINDENYEVLRFYNNFPLDEGYNFFRKEGCHSAEKLPKLHSDSCITFDEFDVAIMFSGGIDSLSLALRHLEKGETVALLSLGFNYNEQVAASLTVRILKSLYQDKVKIFYIFNKLYLNGVESTSGLTQQPFSAFLATFMPDVVKNTAKTLEIAYCMNDDALSFLTELKNIYNNVFKCKQIHDDKSFPKICFPLTKTKHFTNLEFISNIEQKYNVMFPTFSSEFCNVKLLKKDGTSIYSIRTDSNSEKENKQCLYAGYFVKIH